MITKRTDELNPGDVVVTSQGIKRTIRSVREATEQGEPIIWDVQYVPIDPVRDHLSRGAWATRSEQWRISEPSKLDLAVARAQELADEYDVDDHSAFQALHDLLDLLRLFRDAR